MSRLRLAFRCAAVTALIPNRLARWRAHHRTFPEFLNVAPRIVAQCEALIGVVVVLHQAQIDTERTPYPENLCSTGCFRV